MALVPASSASRTPGLRRLAFAGFLLAAFVAPLHHASTRPDAFLLLLGLCACSSLCWLLCCAIDRRVPPLPWPLGLGAALVLVSAFAHLGWLEPPPLPGFTERHWARVQQRWPHSLVPRDPALLTAWAATALLSLCALVDLLREQGRRLLLAAAMVAAGAATVTLGLLQNALHAPGIWWERGVRLPGTFFATFYHHTSAGAFLNLVWPLAAALAWIAVQRRRPVAATLAGLAALLMVASHAAHVSRLPQVLALLGGLALLGLMFPWARLRERRFLFTSAILAALALMIVGVLVEHTGRLYAIRARWAGIEWSGFRAAGERVAPPPESTWGPLVRDDLFIAAKHGGYFMGDRGAAYTAAGAAVAHRPWFGFGPGGWLTAAAQHSDDPFVRTFFLYLQFTHQDALQTLVEWGGIGASGWLLVGVCPWFLGLRRVRREPSTLNALLAATLVGLGAVLAQGLIDFPAQIPALQFYLILLLALLWSLLFADPTSDSTLHASHLHH